MEVSRDPWFCLLPSVKPPSDSCTIAAVVDTMVFEINTRLPSPSSATTSLLPPALSLALSSSLSSSLATSLSSKPRKGHDRNGCQAAATDFQRLLNRAMVLSQQEIEKAHDAFEKFDVDHSGCIDAWELKEAMKSLGQNPTDEEVGCEALPNRTPGSPILASMP
eukprot:758707-Hanusia_phi.AAC.3